MKKAKEWFKELPDDIEKMAVVNARKQGTLNMRCDSLIDSLYGSFPWKATPQGFSFWFNVVEQHYNK